jgi:hypothetical protein
MKLSLEEIIQDLRALEARIRAYERKYGVTSQDFYALYQEGLLPDLSAYERFVGGGQ